MGSTIENRVLKVGLLLKITTEDLRQLSGLELASFNNLKASFFCRDQLLKYQRVGLVSI